MEIGRYPGGYSDDPRDPTPFAYLEVTTVNINDEPHSITSLVYGERLINVLQKENHFVLEVTGNSMNAAKEIGINNGDYVLVRSQKTAENGDVVVAEVNKINTEATLKRFSLRGSKVILSPESNDPSYQEFEFDKRDVGKRVFIRGIVVAVFKKINRKT